MDKSKRAALGILGGTMAAIGGALLVPFVDKALSDESADLWPNPLFLVPIAVLIVGLGFIIYLVFTRDGEKPSPQSSTTFRTKDRSKIRGKDIRSSADKLVDASGASQVELERVDHNPPTLGADAQAEEETATASEEGEHAGQEDPRGPAGGPPGLLHEDEGG